MYEYQELLYDTLTGMPTLPVMLERTRGLIKDRGEVVVFYLNFVRYAKSRRSTAGRSSTRCSRPPRPRCANSWIRTRSGRCA